MPTPRYDAVIIGSGITGGWAAKELTEKGLNTLILEAGRPITPEKDYVEHVPVWELRYRDWDDRKERQATQPIQRECYYACDEFSNKFFVKDSDNPYTSEPGKPFSWIKGRQVGGKSITWGRQSYRWSDLDFEANAKEGIAIDWPIRYADIAPWYDYVEEFAGISGQAEGLPQLPDGKFLPPMEMTCVEQDFRDALFQQPEFHTAGGDEDRQAHRAPVQRCAQPDFRSVVAPRHRSAGNRRPDQKSLGIPGPNRFCLRCDARIHAHPAEFRDAGIS